jgi:hypothetical protein
MRSQVGNEDNQGNRSSFRTTRARDEFSCHFVAKRLSREAPGLLATNKLQATGYGAKAIAAHGRTKEASRRADSC